MLTTLSKLQAKLGVRLDWAGHGHKGGQTSSKIQMCPALEASEW